MNIIEAKKAREVTMSNIKTNEAIDKVFIKINERINQGYLNCIIYWKDNIKLSTFEEEFLEQLGYIMNYHHHCTYDENNKLSFSEPTGETEKFTISW